MLKSCKYQVRMDYDGFRDLFRAQNGTYVRKAGTLSAVCCLFLAPVLLATATSGWMSSAEVPMMVVVAVIVGLVGVLAVWMVVDPSMMLFSRGAMVRHLFEARGGHFAGRGDASCDYEVSLDKEGFTQRSGSGAFGTPWAQLRSKPLQGSRGTYFAFDDGKNSSVAHNMAGVNYAYRQDSPMRTLFIPQEVVDANQGIVEDVERCIREARAR